MYNHGVQLTKGHLSDNGGLRGHSVDSNVFPLVVVAVGNPHEQLFWKVRRPDGQYYFKGFQTAAEAGKFAAGVKAGNVDCMTEYEYANSGGYEMNAKNQQHRQLTDSGYKALWIAKHRMLSAAANCVLLVQSELKFSPITSFDGVTFEFN